MSERDDLLESVANIIRSYRIGRVQMPNAAHVDRWLNQFTPDNQLPFLREFNHVMRERFITRESVVAFLSGLVANGAFLKGRSPVDYWRDANILDIQGGGNSQREMRLLLAEILRNSLSLDINQCGSTAAGSEYIYIDDGLFSGSRALSDLNAWLRTAAPQVGTVHIICIVQHTYGWYRVSDRLAKIANEIGKKINIQGWYILNIENRNAYRSDSGVLWPNYVPDEEATQNYNTWQSQQPYPFNPRVPAALIQPFSSEAGRQVLEQEFLIAGCRIRAANPGANVMHRPLGFGQFGFGFGALVSTYLNCPNNCPLGLWWGNNAPGDRGWYPLLPRNVHASAENAFRAYLKK